MDRDWYFGRGKIKKCEPVMDSHPERRLIWMKGDYSSVVLLSVSVSSVTSSVAVSSTITVFPVDGF